MHFVSFSLIYCLGFYPVVLGGSGLPFIIESKHWIQWCCRYWPHKQFKWFAKKFLNKQTLIHRILFAPLRKLSRKHSKKGHYMYTATSHAIHIPFKINHFYSFLVVSSIEHSRTFWWYKRKSHKTVHKPVFCTPCIY